MKRIFSSFLILTLLCISTDAFAKGRLLQPGEYKLLVYTLNNGDSVSIQDDEDRYHSLYIFPEAMDSLFNRDENYYATPGIGINEDHFQGLSLKAAYSPATDVTLLSSFGLTDTSSNKDLDYYQRLGWEIDLGIAYKFLNKFAYEVHFGYMDTGELFIESNRYTDVEDITIITNKLTMSF